MRYVNRALLAPISFALVAICTGSFAQDVKSPDKTVTGKLAGAKCAANTNPFSTTIGAYPFAHFDLGDGKGQTNGGMLTLDENYQVPQPSFVKSASVGGFWWIANAGNSLYELHVKAMFSDAIGIRAGYLTTSDQHNTAWDGFALYDITSAHYDKRARRAWTVELGPGFYADPSLGHNSVGFSMMVNGALEIGKGFYFNANYWYLNDQATAGHRVMIGVTKTF